MKFVVEVKGPETATDSVLAAVKKSLNAKNLKPGTPEYEAAEDKEARRLANLVFGFVEDGEGFDDAVRLEFDDEAKTVRVLPKRRKK